MDNEWTGLDIMCRKVIFLGDNFLAATLNNMSLLETIPIDSPMLETSISLDFFCFNKSIASDTVLSCSITKMLGSITFPSGIEKSPSSFVCSTGLSILVPVSMAPIRDSFVGNVTACNFSYMVSLVTTPMIDEPSCTTICRTENFSI